MYRPKTQEKSVTMGFVILIVVCGLLTTPKFGFGLATGGFVCFYDAEVIKERLKNHSKTYIGEIMK